MEQLKTTKTAGAVFGTMLVIMLFLFGSLFTFLVADSPSDGSPVQKAKMQTSWPSSWPGGEFLNIWCSGNNTEGTGVYALGPNTTSAQGAIYFQTNSFLTTNPPYSYSSLLDTTKFPTNSSFMLGGSTAIEAGWVADQAVIDPRIHWVYWDDFNVGLESPANITAVYNAVHHEDANLSAPLHLMICIYTNNWYRETVYTWASLEPYFDGITFFHTADTYDATLPQFVGYEDAIREFHQMMPDKIIWIGLYLHHYQLTTAFPAEMTKDQLNIGGQLIKEGIAERYTLHVIYWLPRDTSTASAIKNYCLGEVAQDYRTTIIDTGASFTISTTNGGAISPAVTNFVETPTSEGSRYTFTSNHLQNISINDFSVPDLKVQVVRTGAFVPTVATDATNYTFIARAGEEYRFWDMETTPTWVNATTYIESPTTWDHKEVFLNAKIYLNKTLTIRDSIVKVGAYLHHNSIHNGTTADYGITWNNSVGVRLNVINSTIMPSNLCFTYYLATCGEASGTSGVTISNSTIIGVGGRFNMRGTVYVNDSYFYEAGQLDGTANLGLEIYAQGNTIMAVFQRNHIWNYWQSDLTCLYLPMGGLTYYPEWIAINNNTIVGGRYGMNIDMSYTDYLYLADNTIATSTDLPLTHYDEIVMAGGSPSRYLLLRNTCTDGVVQDINIVSANVMLIDIQEYGSVNPKEISFTINWIGTAGGTVTLTVSGVGSAIRYPVYRDDMRYTAIGSSQSGIFNFVYSGPWSEHTFLIDFGSEAISMETYGIVQIALLFLALGLVVAVVAEISILAKREKLLATDEGIKMMLGMVIFLVIGLVLIRMTYGIVG